MNDYKGYGNNQAKQAVLGPRPDYQALNPGGEPEPDIGYTIRQCITNNIEHTAKLGAMIQELTERLRPILREELQTERCDSILKQDVDAAPLIQELLVQRGLLENLEIQINKISRTLALG